MSPRPGRDLGYPWPPRAPRHARRQTLSWSGASRGAGPPEGRGQAEAPHQRSGASASLAGAETPGPAMCCAHAERGVHDVTE